jgi:hypothetical protein
MGAETAFSEPVLSPRLPVGFCLRLARVEENGNHLGAVKPKIMYVARQDPEGETHWARIGRVTFSKSGRTLYYAGRELRGMGRPWYVDTETGESRSTSTMTSATSTGATSDTSRTERISSRYAAEATNAGEGASPTRTGNLLGAIHLQR